MQSKGGAASAPLLLAPLLPVKFRLQSLGEEHCVSTEADKNKIIAARNQMFRDEAERIVQIADASADSTVGFIACQEDLNCLVSQVADAIFRIDAALRRKLRGATDEQDAQREYEQVRQTLLDCVVAAAEFLGTELRFVWEVSGKGAERILRQRLTKKKRPLWRSQVLS